MDVYSCAKCSELRSRNNNDTNMNLCSCPFIIDSYINKIYGFALPYIR